MKHYAYSALLATLVIVLASLPLASAASITYEKAVQIATDAKMGYGNDVGSSTPSVPVTYADQQYWVIEFQYGDVWVPIEAASGRLVDVQKEQLIKDVFKLHYLAKSISMNRKESQYLLRAIDSLASLEGQANNFISYMDPLIQKTPAGITTEARRMSDVAKAIKSTLQSISAKKQEVASNEIYLMDTSTVEGTLAKWRAGFSSILDELDNLIAKSDELTAAKNQFITKRSSSDAYVTDTAVNNIYGKLGMFSMETQTPLIREAKNTWQTWLNTTLGDDIVAEKTATYFTKYVERSGDAAVATLARQAAESYSSLYYNYTTIDKALKDCTTLSISYKSKLEAMQKSWSQALAEKSKADNSKDNAERRIAYTNAMSYFNAAADNVIKLTGITCQAGPPRDKPEPNWLAAIGGIAVVLIILYALKWYERKKDEEAGDAGWNY